MKYQLSTLFLLILVIAISLGWYVDYSDRNRRDIIGTWRYPIPEEGLRGYGDTLVIRSDGTFTKSESEPHDTTTCQGKYTVNQQGQVVFQVQSRLVETAADDQLPTNPELESQNAEFTFRCAIDQSGYLIIADVNRLKRIIESEQNGDSGIPWQHCYLKK